MDRISCPTSGFRSFYLPIDDLLRRPGPASQESETRQNWNATAFVLTLLLLAFAMAGAATAKSRFFPVLGVGWAAPRGQEVETIYGSGPLLGGGLGCRWSREFSAQVRVDWFTDSGRPVAPLFVDDPSSSLRWIPLTLRFEYAYGQAQEQLLLLAGVGIWTGREEFDYELVGTTRSVSIQSTGPAWSLGAGYQAHRGSMTYRLVGRWMASSAHPQILRGTITSDAKDRVTTSLWTFGLEITP